VAQGLRVAGSTCRSAPASTPRCAAEDQGRVIAGILEDPAAHKGKIYPLFGPVEYTYRETAQVLSRVLGKDVQYKQVDVEEFSRALQANGKKAGRENSFLFQLLREVAIDHQNGIFAPGTNDLVEKLGGRPPMTLEAFIEKHRIGIRVRHDDIRRTRQSRLGILDERARQLGAVKRCGAPLREPSVADGGREQADAYGIRRFGRIGEA
jgi:hypothetical protein